MAGCEDERIHRLKQALMTRSWMYDWMADLRNLENWWRSTSEQDLQSDLSNAFSFRDSKIHLLKKVRDKLHRIESAMVYYCRK